MSFYWKVNSYLEVLFSDLDYKFKVPRQADFMANFKFKFQANVNDSYKLTTSLFIVASKWR